ncbi:MAG TPA: Na+/H+ antiporter NhaA, partial [Terrimesophilobacter sp.]|nr:Na+/H+ antiporter NhaA [Terrimesophilobacter sp.]
AVALPIFAFFAAGVSIVDAGGAGALFAQPVVTAIVVGLVVGKLVGVLATTALVTRFSALRLPESLNLRDLVPVGLLTGIGFTVSLLIAELSFPGAVQSDGAKIAILTATLIATVLAAATLRWDSHKAR